LEALPYAIEERLAEPVEAVHVAIGREVSPRRFLVAVVRHEVMASWATLADSAGVVHAAMQPDALVLPVPPEGLWAVDVQGERALVRCSDGSGFALSTALLPTAWRAAGQPRCIRLGEALPSGLAIETALDLASPSGPAADLNLRQGSYAPAAAQRPLLRRAAFAAAAGLVAHGAVAAADTLALRRIAEERKAEVQALVGDDVVSVATELLPVGGGGPPSRFLPLLGRATAALGTVGSLSVRRMSFDQSGELMLDVEATDGATLQRAEQALRAAGLSPSRTATHPEGASMTTRLAISDPAGGRG
jgi:general secretion pathway protein L